MSPAKDHWQVQEAKQRFSEVIRAVAQDGPQIITRHGEEVAVVIDISDFRRLVSPAADLKGILLGPPPLDGAIQDAFDEIEAQRKQDFGRETELL